MLLPLLLACGGTDWPDEVCDKRDDDRDGEVDEGLTRTFYADIDGDGFGTAATALDACEPPEGFVEVSGDCDDSEAAVHPAAVETCATAGDDDCDGVANPAGAEGCQDGWVDADGDGLGGGEPICACDEPDVRVGGDCDDGDVDRGADCSEGTTEIAAGDLLDLDDPDAYWSLLGAENFGAGEQLAMVSTDQRFLVAALPEGEVPLSENTAAILDAPTWSRPSLVDLDGDGWTDLLAPTGLIDGASYTPTPAVTYGPLLSAPATDTWALDTLASSGPSESTFVADLDADGAPEGWYVFGAVRRAGQVGAWRFDATGVTTLLAPGDEADGAYVSVVPVGDVDSDGLEDLAIYDEVGEERLTIHYGPLTTLPSADDADALLSTDPLDDLVPLGDLDADGRPDLGLEGARIWVLTSFEGPDVATAARTRIGPESDVEGDSALFVHAGDTGADGRRNLLVSDTTWPYPSGAGNLRGALYVFDALPTGVVDARAAERRIYADDYALFGAFPTVLDDGRIAVGAPLWSGAVGLGVVIVVE
jgi:hypothetical protein